MKMQDVRIRDLLFLETTEKHTDNPMVLVDFDTNVAVLDVSKADDTAVLFDGNINDDYLCSLYEFPVKYFTFDFRTNYIVITIK